MTRSATMRRLGWIALGWTFCWGTACQSAPPTPLTIPFTLTADGVISVDATLNESEPVALMFHTAVGSVSMTRTALERIRSVTFEDAANVHSWGGTDTVRYSRSNALRIGSRSWSGLAITEDEHSGRQTDGKFGCHLFEGEIIEIDYERRRLRLHAQLPPLDSAYERFDVAQRRGGLFLKGSVQVGDTLHPNEFLIHSGFNGTVLFDDGFAQAHGLADALAVLARRELKDSLGNVIETRTVRVPALRFGGMELPNVPAELFPGSTGMQQISVLGADVLRRFHILLDPKAGHVYLRPNARFPAAFS